jgi:hypothetical protein
MNRNLIIPHSAVNYKISLLLKSFCAKWIMGNDEFLFYMKILKWLVLWHFYFIFKSHFSFSAGVEFHIFSQWIFDIFPLLFSLLLLLKHSKSMRSQSTFIKKFLVYSWSCFKRKFYSLNDMMTLMDMVKFEENMKIVMQ